MNLSFSAEEEDFRSEVREFLEPYAGLDGFFQQGRKWNEVKAFFREVGKRGWLSLTWPSELGGAGKSETWEYILWDEMAYARAGRPLLSAGIVAKSLIGYGSEAQKRRYLPGIAAGELHFSLGYSEPEAGSDLASLRTRAVRQGERYLVNGEKCWTSYAQDSDYLWLLARTGTPESRSRGLSLFILELHAPGVTIHPLPTMDDEQLNEIRLDAVEVPLDNRVGPENGAWKIIGEALAVERHVQFPPKRALRDLEDLVEFLRAQGRERDPVVRWRVAKLAVEVREAEAHALRVLVAIQKGRPAVVEAAANKLSATDCCQHIARAALDLGGPEALVRGQRVELLWRQSMGETIGGGTSEIMRSTIARQQLRLEGRA